MNFVSENKPLLEMLQLYKLPDQEEVKTEMELRQNEHHAEKAVRTQKASI